MTIAPRPIALAVVAASLVCALFPSLASARHAWGKYHWAHNSTTARLPLNVYNNLSGTAWGGNVLDTYAISPWNAGCTGDSPNPDSCLGAQPGGAAIGSRVLLTDIGPASGVDPAICPAITGAVEVCNYRYGNTGWLGIAQIWVTRNHIRQGVVKLNDTFLIDDSNSNTDAWRKMVICQEIGHTFGLDHQDENFNNSNLGTCMDYTNSPAGTLNDPNNPSNESPNYHDFEQLAIIYNHNDTAGGGGSGKGGGKPEIPPATYENLNDRAKWGVLRRESNNGRTALYERDLGGGHRLFTFVIWAR